MLDDPILALKRELADRLLGCVAHLNASIAAQVLEIDDARMSDLRGGRIARFSIERLIRMLATVNRHVELSVIQDVPGAVRWLKILRERQSTRHSKAHE